KEVSVATVAAVLTVLGYSIYDTIIIFDRVRENIPLMRKQPFATIVNVSLWETIRRSLATTFITLLPIIALEILGGATLKDCAVGTGRPGAPREAQAAPADETAWPRAVAAARPKCSAICSPSCRSGCAAARRRSPSRRSAC